MGDTFTFFVPSGLGPPMALGSSVSIKKLPFFDSWPPTSTRARYKSKPRLQEVAPDVPGAENPSCCANANIWTIAPTWIDGLNGAGSLLNICFLLISINAELRTYCNPGYSSKRLWSMVSFPGRPRVSPGPMLGPMSNDREKARPDTRSPARSSKNCFDFIPK